MSKNKIKIKSVDNVYEAFEKAGFFDNDGKHLDKNKRYRLCASVWSEVHNNYLEELFVDFEKKQEWNLKIKKFIDNIIDNTSKDELEKLDEAGFFETDIFDEIIVEFDIDLTSEWRAMILNYLNSKL